MNNYRMRIKSFVFNPVQENTYVIWDESKECAIVDAGCLNEKEFETLDSFIRTNSLKPIKLLNTHGHFDHIFGVEACRKAYGLKWEAHNGDNPLILNAPAQAAMFGLSIEKIKTPDIELAEGDILSFGNTVLSIIHVPGHSQGSICFYNEKDKIIITGDVLFRGSIGRTDLPGGDYDTLISGIKNKLLKLPSETSVFPGHGPSSTIGDENSTNPFLQ
jgi:glyoxylase-like metal-dependent hydrolase (beta-lactamase superfamily II)